MTYEQYFKENLSPIQYDRAIANCPDKLNIEINTDIKTGSPLGQAFSFSQSNEGFSYWANVQRILTNGTIND
jgi:hypothetical protein